MPVSRTTVHVDGGALEAVLEGAGAITVVFENGMATPLEEWDAVVPRIAARARVLRYDPRYAPAAGPVAPRFPADVLGDLKHLLTDLALEPPYVFVGHSWGGVVARLFAHAHPSAVAGLVFVDATHEAIDERSLAVLPAMYTWMLFAARARFVRRWLLRQLCPEGASAAYRARLEQRLNDPIQWPVGLRTARAESAAIAPALARLRSECPDLPRIPVHVLTANEPSKSAQRVRDGWQATVARAPGARYTHVTNSRHYISIDCPDVVVDAILGVLDAIESLPNNS